MRNRSQASQSSHLLLAATLFHVACSSYGTAETTPPDARAVTDAPAPLGVDAPAPQDAPRADAPSAGTPGAMTETAYIGTFLGGLHALAVDRETGALTEQGDAAIAGSYYAIALDPSRRFLYGVDLDHGKLFSYRVGAGGGLTPLAGSPMDIGGHPITIAADPLGRYVYVGIDASIAVYAVDAASGVLTAVPRSPFFAGAAGSFIAAEPAGRFVYASQQPFGAIAAFAVDAESGSLTEIAGSTFLLPERERPGGIVFDSAGKHLYYGAGKLYGFTIDATSGALALLPGAPFPGSVGSDGQAIDIAIDPLGRYVYTVANTGSTVSAYRIEAATGALAPIEGSPFAAGTMPYSVAVDPDGRFVYVGNDDAGQVTALSIDVATGALTKLATSPFPVNGLQPEIIVARPPSL